LSNSIYLSLDYRVNLGVVNLYEQEVNFSEQPDLTEVKQGNIGINGTSNAFQLGLKYKFVSKGK
jgi:hypothetical protein